ncbi:MAG: DUF896 domain-containing protein [Bacillota bacterium]
MTAEEKKEQEELRKEYLGKFREHFKGHLESIQFVDENGNCVERGKQKN